MGGEADGWMDGRMDGQIDTQTGHEKYLLSCFEVVLDVVQFELARIT